MKPALGFLLQLCNILNLVVSTAIGPQSNINAVTIDLNVDVAANRHEISPYIYGLNFATESFANEIDLPLRRWGGNATSRYNWQTNTLSSANDWYFENNTNTNAYDWNQPETYDQWVNQNINTGTSSLITIPMLGYLSKDGTSCSFSIAKYGAQQDHDPNRADCGNGVNTIGQNIVNTPGDASVATNSANMQAWVATLVANHGSANAGGVQFYALDNEPELWSETHRDVHPIAQSYDELLAKSVDYGEAIKTADPNAKIFGYASFGWSGFWYSQKDMDAAALNGYTYFPDYATHGNKYQVEWYLDEMKKYEQNNGTRLLDYLDLHFYPQNGVGLATAGDAATQALRLRSTHALWDPTYQDESWIGGNDQPADWQKVRLIPRMKDWVNTYYPGTKLAITEYNFGGLESINGALAQAEVLGIFGREGLDVAALWNYPNPGNDPLGYDQFASLPGAYAFRMFRNYDGNGSKFGTTSVSANSPDQSQLSIFAAQRNSDNALTLLIVNKTSSSISSAISIANFDAGTSAQVYEYSGANLNAIVHKADVAISGSVINTSFSANSITLLVIPTSSAQSFSDVPVSYWAWQFIERLYSAGITGGCGNGNYCPTAPVTRAQMAVFLLKGIHTSSFTPPAVGVGTGFTDVDTSHWAAAWIKQLAAEAITSGCGSGIYCPENSVTRAQMAVFLLKSKHGASYSPPPATGTFGDVPADYWAAAWIEQLASEAITSGCASGLYCPDTPVTRDQMAVFLVKAFNLP